MPIYDCGDPDCYECQRAFGPDRTAAIRRFDAREIAYAELEEKANAASGDHRPASPAAA